MTAPSRRARFPADRVHQPKARGLTPIREHRQRLADREACATVLDALTDGQPDPRQADLLRTMSEVTAERRGLTLSTSMHLASLAGQASLAATKRGGAE